MSATLALQAVIANANGDRDSGYANVPWATIDNASAALEAVQVEPVAKPMAIVCDCEGTTDDDGRPLHYALLYLDHPLPPGTELYATPQQAAPGWQLVPIEPSERFMSSGAEFGLSRSSLRVLYSAALEKAAPKAPV